MQIGLKSADFSSESHHCILLLPIKVIACQLNSLWMDWTESSYKMIVAAIIFSNDPCVKMVLFSSLIQPCKWHKLLNQSLFPRWKGNHLLHYSSALLWKRDCEGMPRDKERGIPPFTPPFLISWPDNSPLLLVEQHLCPPLQTAEICLWCKHPCLSPWQPSLLPAVGCHASRLPPSLLPQPLALYCRWHVREDASTRSV